MRRWRQPDRGAREMRRRCRSRSCSGLARSSPPSSSSRERDVAVSVGIGRAGRRRARALRLRRNNEQAQASPAWRGPDEPGCPRRAPSSMSGRRGGRQAVTFAGTASPVRPRTAARPGARRRDAALGDGFLDAGGAALSGLGEFPRRRSRRSRASQTKARRGRRLRAAHRVVLSTMARDPGSGCLGHRAAVPGLHASAFSTTDATTGFSRGRCLAA